jgi:EmrB/QacA subfamily drug resistance transporter
LLDSHGKLSQLIAYAANELRAFVSINVSPPEIIPYQSTGKRNLAVTGVMLVVLLFAIDATIVSTAMPTIVARLGGLELYSWVFSIYMLTSALTTPLFGKLSDLFSRRRLMLIGIGIFVLGSTLCGAAQSMEMLILFRAIQGLGGGAIYALSFIVVGILFPPEKRATMQGIISGIWGLASILGPLAGGIIVEHWSWRWAFFVNLPITAIACGLIVIGLKQEKTARRAHRLDLQGAALLLVGLLLLFYALAESSQSIRPANPQTIGTAALGLAVLLAFFLIERRAEEPIIPLDLFHLSLFRTSASVAALASMGVFGAITYLPLYLQGVIGLSASRAGMVLLLLSLGWTAGSLLAGRAMNRMGYRFVGATGMILLALGYGVFIVDRVGVPLVLLSGILIGIGMGLANLATLVAAQNAVRFHRIGVATSTIMLFRTFGGAFSVSLMGTVLLNQMQQKLNRMKDDALSSALFDKLANPQNLLEQASRAQIPQEWLPKLIAVLADSIWYAFFAAFILMVAGVVVSLSLGHYTPANTPRPAERQGSKELQDLN